MPNTLLKIVPFVLQEQQPAKKEREVAPLQELCARNVREQKWRVDERSRGIVEEKYVGRTPDGTGEHWLTLQIICHENTSNLFQVSWVAYTQGALPPAETNTIILRGFCETKGNKQSLGHIKKDSWFHLFYIILPLGHKLRCSIM